MYFELCEISCETQCSYCSKYWADCIVYCTCGTCLIPTEYTKRLTKETFDTLSIVYLVITKGSRHGARCGKTDKQREYRQARDCLGRCLQKGYSTVLQRLPDHGTYRESPQAVGWTEDTCRHVDQKAKQDRSYIATWRERQRYENNWKPALNAQGRNAPMTEKEKITPKLSRQSKICVRKTNRKVIVRFYRAIRLVKDHFKKGSGNGVPGAHHLRPRHGQSRKPGGPQR